MTSKNYLKSIEFTTILDNKILIGDGAMGTILQEMGFEGCPDAINKDKEDIKKVKDIHLNYLKAGSNIIQTNTFGSNPLKLESCNLAKDIELINRNAAANARDAVDSFNSRHQYTFVAGDVGPLGKILEPSGNIKYSQAVDMFKRQIEILIDSGVDLILIETIMDLNEALAAVEATKKIASDIALICTMTFNQDGVTMMGNKAEDTVPALLKAGCNVVGANCSTGSETMLNTVKRMRKANSDAKLIFQPNAGMPVLIDGKTTFNETPEVMADNMKKFLKYNPSIIGACCGSTHEHIKKIAELIEQKP